MATSKQASRHTHNFHKCSHASVALTQARPNNTGNHLEQQICSFLSPDYGLLLELHALTLVAHSYARLNRYTLQSDSQLGEQHRKISPPFSWFPAYHINGHFSLSCNSSFSSEPHFLSQKISHIFLHEQSASLASNYSFLQKITA